MENQRGKLECVEVPDGKNDGRRPGSGIPARRKNTAFASRSVAMLDMRGARG